MNDNGRHDDTNLLHVQKTNEGENGKELNQGSDGLMERREGKVERTTRKMRMVEV